MALSKVIDPDEIPVVVLKDINLELYPSDIILKEKLFRSPWKILSLCPVFKNAGERSSPLNIDPSIYK